MRKYLTICFALVRVRTPPQQEKKSSFLCSYFLFSSSSFVLVYCFPFCLFLLRPRTQSTQLLIMSLSLSLPFSFPPIFRCIYCYKTNMKNVAVIHIQLFLGYNYRCILPFRHPHDHL